MKGFLFYISTFLIGILPAFFIVLNSVYTDSSGKIGERLVTYLLVIAGYGIIGFILGRVMKRMPVVLGTVLSLPAIILLLLYLFKEPTLLGLILSYLVLTVAASWLGTILGVRKSSNPRN